MRWHPALSLPLAGLLALMGAAGRGPNTGPTHTATTFVEPNSNTARAGVVRNGTLTVALEAGESPWRLNGPARAPMTIAAFHEPGKAPMMPGPLVRATVGTVIHFAIHNALAKPLTFFVPAAVGRESAHHAQDDSILVAPGATGSFTTTAAVPGTYIYRATTGGRPGALFGVTGLLAGALVVDTAATHDRVMVIMETPDSGFAACVDTLTKGGIGACGNNRLIFTINGRSWPNTEREHATVGDSLHWRIINASYDSHPMHLHGFYYRVDEYSEQPNAPQPPPAPGQMVVTQVMSPFSTMAMTWSPNRPGNWLFHCHFAVHLQPDSLSGQPDDPYLRDMSGLVIGTLVAARPGVTVAGSPAATRHLRLVATADGALHERPHDLGKPSDLPTMAFVLEENGKRISTGRDISPEIDLVRGQPVAITVVNHLQEPTSVHWHGIEVQDSYMDGVAGFSGSGNHLSPMIAPSDSFTARFTPTRAGTFMYHAHMDEMRQDAAGMEGPLIVRDPDAAPDSDEHVIFYKGVVGNPRHPVEINGQADPDTLVLHAGRPARFRIMNLSTNNVVGQFWLTARPDSAARIANDSMVVQWRIVAKDGFDWPASRRTLQPARRVVAVGETCDFVYTPEHAGTLRLEVRGSGAVHPLFARVPILVR